MHSRWWPCLWHWLDSSKLDDTSSHLTRSVPNAHSSYDSKADHSAARRKLSLMLYFYSWNFSARQIPQSGRRDHVHVCQDDDGSSVLLGKLIDKITLLSETICHIRFSLPGILWSFTLTSQILSAPKRWIMPCPCSSLELETRRHIYLSWLQVYSDENADFGCCQKKKKNLRTAPKEALLTWKVVPALALVLLDPFFYQWNLMPSQMRSGESASCNLWLTQNRDSVAWSQTSQSAISRSPFECYRAIDKLASFSTPIICRPGPFLTCSHLKRKILKVLTARLPRIGLDYERYHEDSRTEQILDH